MRDPEMIIEEIRHLLFDYPEQEEGLMHYGVKYRSGRYPYGSGEDPYQHDREFLGRVKELRKQGYTYTDEKGHTYTGDTAVAKALGMTSGEFRLEVAVANNELKLYDINTAKRLRDKEGLNNSEIARKMGVGESTVRSWFKGETEAKLKASQKTADFLKEQVDSKKMIDVGAGAEYDLNVSRKNLDNAIYSLQRQGYNLYKNRMSQPTNPGNYTTQYILCAPDVKYKDTYQFDKIGTLKEYTSHDGGDTFDRLQYPASLSSKRIRIHYGDEKWNGVSGDEQDGIIELRRGVKDLDLGNNHYAQCRILVDGTHYLKGMAVYSDNLPDGVDVVFNTNKKKGTPMTDVLKPIKDDPDNPFGALIKPQGQSYYTDTDGKRKLSVINKTREENDWEQWKDSLPSQFLGKQSKEMAQRQLNIAKADKVAEFEDIKSLTNPTIKKHLLKKFSDECDSAAVELRGAALPGQKYHVIIPVPSLKDNEVYAPRYQDGTKLALIRYPHGGTFEIPILTVNNRNKEARDRIGINSVDGIGITKAVADILSGADFDGDTVMTIPTHDRRGKVKITSRDPLPDLVGFDPKVEYPERPGMKYMKYKRSDGKEVDNTQKEMGVISNLITDMTLGGATDDELTRAVKHSMVVIDAGKHKLDYRKSYIDNNISELVNKYQRKVDPETGEVKVGGASTILSRSGGDYRVVKRQGEPRINAKGKTWYDPTKPEGSYIYKTSDDAYYVDSKYDKKTGRTTVTTVDGRKITYDSNDPSDRAKYTPVKKTDPNTGEVYFESKDGRIRYKTNTHYQVSTNMAETQDANSLVSELRHPMELIYADYANSMKSLANEARKEYIRTGSLKYSKEAREKYKNEYNSLMAKLNKAEMNRTRERQALRQANAEIRRKKEDNPNLSKSDVRKISQQAVTKARSDVGSIKRSDRNIVIEPKEWEAIQSGAITETILNRILNNADIGTLRELATPRTKKQVTPATISRIKALSASYTIAQIADKLGLSTSVVSKYLKE